MATYVDIILTGFLKEIVKSHIHTSAGISVDYSEASLGGYLPTFYVNWIVNIRQKPQTRKHRHLGGLPRGLLGWLPTYIYIMWVLKNLKSS